MNIHYLEIVTTDVEGVCLGYANALKLTFGDPDELLGNARTAKLLDGSIVGVRAPLSDVEVPIVRPYWLVENIEEALIELSNAGAEIIHPPLELPGKGTFAIYAQGGGHHGLWQL